MSRNREESKKIWKAIGVGALAGLAGTIVMTASEKLEQRLTGRPNSYVPAHTLERLLGLRERPNEQRNGRNIAMHVFNGVLGGVMRGMLARAGARGLSGFAAFTLIRLSLDEVAGLG